MHLAEQGGFQHYEKLASLFTQQSDLSTTTEPVKYKSTRAKKNKKNNRFPYISAEGGSRNMALTGGEGTKSIQRMPPVSLSTFFNHPFILKAISIFTQNRETNVISSDEQLNNHQNKRVSNSPVKTINETSIL